jgi:hypothetical protein
MRNAKRTGIQYGWLVMIGLLLYPLSGIGGALVVVESQRVVGYRVGDLLPLDQSLSLAPDAQLVLLTAQGEKIQVQGPLEGSLAERLQDTMPDMLAQLAHQDSDMLQSLASILQQHRSASLRTRSVHRAPEPKDVWQISVLSADDQCYQDGQLPQLWRPRTGSGDAWVIRAQNLQDETLVRFQQDGETHPWPIDLDLREGEEYLVLDRQGGREQKLTLHLIPGDLPTRAHVAASLNARNCARQAAQLLILSDIDKFIGRLITFDQF